MDEKKITENCMVCGSALAYLQHAETMTCSFCGKDLQGHMRCAENHFVCESCHTGDLRAVIESLSCSTASGDPFKTAELMMKHANLPMLGCEHALITAGALMAALRNSPYGREKITDNDIREVLARTATQAVSGYCGLTGVCGIAPAVGACVSMFLGARCGSDKEQKITMDAVIEVSRAIVDLTGPSCCKAYTRAAIAAAVDFFAARLGIVLPASTRAVLCRDDARHPHGCRGVQCPYYQKPAKDIFAEGKFVPGTVSAC